MVASGKKFTVGSFHYNSAQISKIWKHVV